MRFNAFAVVGCGCISRLLRFLADSCLLFVIVACLRLLVAGVGASGCFMWVVTLVLACLCGVRLFWCCLAFGRFVCFDCGRTMCIVLIVLNSAI